MPAFLVVRPGGEIAAAAACPVLGVGCFAAAQAALCDVIVQEEGALAPLLANIARAPMAAAVLVQVLRATEGLPVRHALVVESLAYASLQGGAENRAWLAQRRVTAPAADGGPAVVLERDGETLRVRLARPHGFNAVTIAMRNGLAEALSLAALDDSIRAVEISAEGRCFSVGGALEEFGTAPDQATAHAVRCDVGPAFMLAPVAARTTAVVHGACIGAGLELAALCRQVVIKGDAFFQLPEIRVGLIPGSGGTVGVARRIGRQRTAWLALSARRIGARQALAWGLADRIEHM